MYRVVLLVVALLLVIGLIYFVMGSPLIIAFSKFIVEKRLSLVPMLLIVLIFGMINYFPNRRK